MKASITTTPTPASKKDEKSYGIILFLCYIPGPSNRQSKRRQREKELNQENVEQFKL